jgi:hypothetical protein
MVHTERKGITLQLSEQEAEDLHGLLWAHVAGAAADRLSEISSALGEAKVNATRFRAHNREGRPGLVVLADRIGSEEF